VFLDHLEELVALGIGFSDELDLVVGSAPRSGFLFDVPQIFDVRGTLLSLGDPH
jgi:hypothetical protein